MKKIVRYLGKILSPYPNTVTSDLGCCCGSGGCLCCGLTSLIFILQEPYYPMPSIKTWESELIQDPDCPYINQNPPNNNGPGSAYGLVVTINNNEWNFSLALYCDNTPSYIPVLTPQEQDTVTELNDYPTGVVIFNPIDDPNSGTYNCRIQMEFDGTNQAMVKFSRVSV